MSVLIWCLWLSCLWLWIEAPLIPPPEGPPGTKAFLQDCGSYCCFPVSAFKRKVCDSAHTQTQTSTPHKHKTQAYSDASKHAVWFHTDRPRHFQGLKKLPFERISSREFANKRHNDVIRIFYTSIIHSLNQRGREQENSFKRYFIHQEVLKSSNKQILCLNRHWCSFAATLRKDAVQRSTDRTWQARQSKLPSSSFIKSK